MSEHQLRLIREVIETITVTLLILIGKAIVIYWPATTWNVVNTYPSVYASLRSK